MSGTKIVAIPVVGKHTINAHLVLGRRPILVDAGIPGSAERILNQVRAHGVDPADIALIVLTHGHIDHFGSAAELRRLTGAPVAGHAGDLDPYTTGRVREPYLPTGPFGTLLARNSALHVAVDPVLPDLVLHGELRLDDHGVDARVIPTPGHTAGTVSVLTDDGELLAGDMIAGSFLGTIATRPANPPFHDDAPGNLTSLRAMLDLGPVRLHVGHGGPLDPDRVRAWTRREHHRLTRLARSGRLAIRQENADRPTVDPSPVL
ncbi:MBL fold metallo-hydrolase [Longispora sp. K20-0274]|uniref:MBL fold metallo-hydrolase n=1 Tax=Longispora sp. K20-0274 TaxID=3088255 RepID=UPI00399A5D6E